MPPTDEVIRRFGMIPHPEGGHFVEIHRSNLEVRFGAIEGLAAATSILYLLTPGDFSAFHRLSYDEVWHYYWGAELEHFIISPNGELLTSQLGDGSKEMHVPFVVVPAGCYQAARPVGGPVLCGCTVAPGFHDGCFELATRGELSRRFPRHRRLIESLTRVEIGEP